MTADGSERRPFSTSGSMPVMMLAPAFKGGNRALPKQSDGAVRLQLEAGDDVSPAWHKQTRAADRLSGLARRVSSGGKLKRVPGQRIAGKAQTTSNCLSHFESTSSGPRTQVHRGGEAIGLERVDPATHSVPRLEHSHLRAVALRHWGGRAGRGG